MIRGAAALAAALVLACDAPPAHQPPISVTGTFSDARTRIVIELGPDDEYVARAGNAAVPVTYDADGDCHRVTFTLPDGRFSGCLGANALVGGFQRPEGAEERVYLKRQRK